MDQISFESVVTSHLLPIASHTDRVPQAAIENTLLPVLRSLGTRSPALITALRTATFVPTSNGIRVAPGELFDPRIPQLRQLVGSQGPYPLDSWLSDAGVMAALEQLGMRTALDSTALLDIARRIEQTALADPQPPAPELIASLQQRGRALMDALDALAAASDDDAPEVSFWGKLSVLSFVPVYTAPPVNGLPWPQAAAAGVAPPKMVRLNTDMWLASASLRILQGPCSDQLAEKFQWNAAPQLNVLAAQLLELGREKFEDAEAKEQASAALPRLYGYFNSPELLQGPQAEMLKLTLEGSAFVWVGDKFVGADVAVLDSPADYKPYIYAVPHELSAFDPLFKLLGVPSTPSVAQYARALHNVAMEHGTADPLQPDTLTLVSSLAESLALATLNTTGQASESVPTDKCYLPDVTGTLAPSSMIYYDDASWLSREGLRIVHPDIGVETAKTLGAHSLREHHQLETQATSSMPCPPAALLQQMLDTQADPGRSTTIYWSL